LNSSALLDGAVTVSPLPGSRDAPAGAQISFLGLAARRLAVQSVLGSRSGRHSGTLRPYSQGDGASFVPARPFAEGERVTVRARVSSGGRSRELVDRFAVASEDRLSSRPQPLHGRVAHEQSFASRPDLRPPLVRVTSSSAAGAAGYLFAAPYDGPDTAGPMIFDQTGQLVWFDPLPRHTAATNFRVQSYMGRPVLTWWQGDATEHGFGLGEDVIEDSSYQTLARVGAGNGLRADLHEFELTPAGTALITAYHAIDCDLSSVGGPAGGAVTDGVMQEIDVATGLVMFEWTSLDHVGLSESHEHARISSREWPFDYFHINSIDLAPAGTLLVSARNTWALYALDARSGRVQWRLGGRSSSFAAGPGTQTAFQHDARLLANGSVSVFDNGAGPRVHKQSRAVVLTLDPVHRSVKLARQLLHTPPLLAESQGDVQALAGGSVLVGWGQQPYLTEFGPLGEVLLDAHFPRYDESYRVFLFPWTGVPAHSPRFSFAGGAGGGVVYASWNGATGVAAWRVLAGTSPTDLQPVAQAQRSGFETAIALAPGVTGPYLAVQALDASGQPLGVSQALAQPGLP
jgi:Arylsulfotransferase (ASST)